MLVAVALRDGDDQLLADVAREIEVDVRDRGELVVEKAPEREVVRDRIDVREAGEVTDDRADRAAAPPSRWQEAAGRVATAHLQGALAGEVEHLPVEQEEPREVELVDQRELALEAIARPREQPLVARWIAVGEGVVADLGELADRGLVAVGEVGIAVAELLGEVELEALRDLDGAGGGGRVDAGEEVGRICRRPQDALAVAAPLLLAAVEGGAAADRDERVLEERAPRRMGMHVAGGDGVRRRDARRGRAGPCCAARHRARTAAAARRRSAPGRRRARAGRRHSGPAPRGRCGRSRRGRRGRRRAPRRSVGRRSERAAHDPRGPAAGCPHATRSGSGTGSRSPGSTRRAASGGSRRRASPRHR